MGQLLFALSSLGVFGYLPWILNLVAIVDVVRVGASWYWIWIILMFPGLGALAYFVVVRSGWLGGRGRSLSPSTARRLQARRRIRQLNVQLTNWRGPAVLAEMGDELLVLAKYDEALRHFLEAQKAGGAIEDVNFGLAQAYQMLDRYPEAVPPLDELVRQEPDAYLGRALMQLGRSLDESGEKERAEQVLRQVLARRTIIEAQVRLARLLLARGEKDEAQQILAEVKTDAAVLPRYLRREHGAWIRAARSLRTATASLPKPWIEGGEKPGRRLRLALAAVAALIVVFLVGRYVLGEIDKYAELQAKQQQERQQKQSAEPEPE